jgi:homoserine O-acetyltransferase/O-succinyltransferase
MMGIITYWCRWNHPGPRRFAGLFVAGSLGVELGGHMGPLTVAYEWWGTPAPDGGNAVLVEHPLTADSHAAGNQAEPGKEEGWWEGMIGPGLPIDTNRWWVICANVLGGCQGTTGPSSPAPDGRPWGSRFPGVTVRDQVAVEAGLADFLGVARWAAVIGGSLGGMRALEWAVMHPARVERLIVLAATAQASAEQIALSAVQALAIRSDPRFAGGDYYGSPGPGPGTGLGLAWRIGHIARRSESELVERFGRRAQASEDPFGAGRYAVEGYLDDEAAELVARFDANSYLVLNRAMEHHDLGRGRGGLEAALSSVQAQTTVVSIDSDRLCPPYQQEQLAELLPRAPTVEVVRSPYGHDAFLIETEQVGKVVAGALDT